MATSHTNPQQMTQEAELTVAEQINVLGDLYSQRAEAYDRLWSPVIRPLGERLISRLRLSDAKRVLDVGTGAGALLPAIQRAAPEATVFGMRRVENLDSDAYWFHGTVVIATAIKPKEIEAIGG